MVRTFTIENAGTGNLTVSSITMSGADATMFTVGGISFPATISGSGGSTTFTVTFAPTSAGLKTATVNVANNDCDEANYDFGVQGTGVTDPCASDQTGPTIVPKNATVYLDANGNASIVPADVIQSLSDNCTATGNIILGVSPNTFNCTNISSGTSPGPDQQAYKSATNQGNQEYYGEIGLEFSVNNSNGIIIKQLGAFDHQGNGLNGTQTGGGIRVAVFRKSDQSIVPGLDVTITGTGDHYISNFRTKDLASPVTLVPGIYVLLAKGYNPAELNGNILLGGSPYPAGDNGGGAVSFLSTAHWGDNTSSGFSYPNLSADLGPNTFLAGTFVFTTAAAAMNTVTITAEDTQGNVSQVNAQVNVVDNTGPTITPKNITVFLDQSGHATIQPSDVIQDVTDNCQVNTSSYTVSPNSFDCSNAASPGPNHQSYSSNTTMGNQAFAGELGLEFTVNAPGGIVVNHLGAFDHQGDGISPSGGIRVAIFRKSDQSIVSGLDALVAGNSNRMRLISD